MSFGKWNTGGELSWADGQALTSSNLNDSADETIPPIGAVIAWLKSYTNTPATLPSGWVECNGQVLSDADSPYNTQTLPNLNASGGGTNYFLRGSTTSGGTGGNLTHTHAMVPAGAYAFAGGSTELNSPNHEPPYYDVVWIMRIK